MFVFIFTCADARRRKRTQTICSRSCLVSMKTFTPYPTPLPVRQIPWLGRKGRTNFRAPIFDFGFDGVADLAGARKFLVVAALQSGGIGEAPVQPRRHTGEDGATFGARFVADGNDEAKSF